MKLIDRNNNRKSANTIKQAKRVDFQDEFMSHYEEFS